MCEILEDPIEPQRGEMLHPDWEGAAREMGRKPEERGARPHKGSVSRRREWTTVSNTAKRSSEMSPEKYSLDLMTSWSLGTLARAASDGEKDRSWPRWGEKGREVVRK